MEDKERNKERNRLKMGCISTTPLEITDEEKEDPRGLVAHFSKDRNVKSVLLSNLRRYQFDSTLTHSREYYPTQWRYLVAKHFYLCTGTTVLEIGCKSDYYSYFIIFNLKRSSEVLDLKSSHYVLMCDLAHFEDVRDKYDEIVRILTKMHEKDSNTMTYKKGVHFIKNFHILLKKWNHYQNKNDVKGFFDIDDDDEEKEDERNSLSSTSKTPVHESSRNGSFSPKLTSPITHLMIGPPSD